MEPLLNRRRFLMISAAAAAVPGTLHAATSSRWRGTALGADASMTIGGLGPARAQPVFRAVEAELTRLEGIFSLYAHESELSRLNRDGHLDAPSLDLLEVLSLSGKLNTHTSGAFDPTIQPLWLAHARAAAVEQDLSPADTRETLGQTGWGHLHFNASMVRFDRPGMALTLNGVAQGYITDQIVKLLRASGLHNVLIDIGEIAAIGRRHDGARWNVGVARPDGTLVHRLTLSGRALATSAPLGTVLDQRGHVGHIINPDNGLPSAGNALVSVSAPNAAVADGLSTALCLLPRDETAKAVAAFPGARIEYIN